MKYIARTLRIVYRGLRHGNSTKYDITVQSSDVSEFIYSALSKDKPFMACRFGSTEFAALQQGFLRNEHLLRRFIAYVRGYVDSYQPKIEESIKAIDTLCFFSGFFPSETDLLDRFYHLMKKSMTSVDLLGVWQKEDLFKQELPNAEFCELGCLEPYDFDFPWTRALLGRKVLVIHPFASTIESQYRKKELLWANKDVLPEFELKTIKAVQTIAGEKTEFNDWFSALDSMKRQIDSIDFDIAIIGCGAYGFPLAAYVKSIGKKAVHLGGATQILFGIKGKRWDAMPAVCKYYNESWIYPTVNETPTFNYMVEDGCYW